MIMVICVTYFENTFYFSQTLVECVHFLLVLDCLTLLRTDRSQYSVCRCCNEEWL